MDVYEWADRSINATGRCEAGFTQLLSTKPYTVSPTVRRNYDARLSSIRSYQKTALGIFRAALNNDVDPVILHWLLNEIPDSLGLAFHRRLEDRHFTLPVFFRTDEVRHGRLSEVQCPGSHWGELQLGFEYSALLGYLSGDVSPADQFVAQLTGLLQASPVVQHFVDRASAPVGVRYFIEKTRPGIRYWGVDRGVKVSDCNFIRHQAFVDLWSEDFLPARLEKMGHGLLFDAPPYLVFDQKAALVLPFWSATRKAFSDEIRELFPFTTPLLPSGIEMPDGACVTIEEFSRRPQSLRAYYLKYAGADWTRNWGSQTVYRLSNLGGGQCLGFLRQCLAGYERGEIWLLQKEEFQDDEIEYLTRDGQVHRQSLRAKFSGFYGPDGCLGVMALHRAHFKVHGQDETVMSYVVAGAEDRIAPWK